MESYKIFSIGEDALTVECGNEISEKLNDKVLALADFFDKNPFNGFVETVLAYSSLTIFYDLSEVRRMFPHFPTAFAAVKNQVEIALRNLPELPAEKRRLIEIPVSYNRENAPDLEFVAELNGLSCEDVVRIHTEKVYRVFMLGFLPGFAYMGEVDKRIVAPRKQVPRTKIKKGSVGIAGKQTGIYPLDSPGGWQIIGKTALEMFQPASEKLTFLQAGDLVKFYRI